MGEKMDKLNISKSLQKSTRISEAYKTLRANIEFSGKQIKTIAITSCVSNEGKSTVSLNLASSLADLGKGVCFIDADMRRSTLSGRLHVSKNTQGLSNMLAGQCTLDDVICETDNENLDIILAGVYPPNPSEMLAQKEFSAILHELREDYDYVIIDTPPLGSVIDGAIVGKNCDGVIVIVEENRAVKDEVKSVIAQLQKAKCHILGIVMNKVNISRSSYKNKYYNSYTS